MPQNKSILILCTLLAVCISAHANSSKEIQVYNLNSRNGLSHNLVNSVCRDEFGYVWIATEDGLNRFDGRTIEVFRPESWPDLTSNKIKEVISDGEGHIFLRSNQDLSKLDLKTFKIETICKENVFSMCYTNEHLYWASHNKVFRDAELVFKYDGTDSSVIRDIATGGGETLYILLGSGKILRQDRNGNISEFSFKDALGLDSDETGAVWVTSHVGGVMRILPDGGTRIYSVPLKEKDASDRNNTRGVVQIDKDNFYVASYGGLSILNITTGEFTKCIYDTGMKGFSNQAIRSISSDGEYFFLGTFHAGLHYFSNTPERFRLMNAEKSGVNHLTSPVISAVVTDRRGILWVGTVSGGLNIIDDESKLGVSFRTKIQSDTRLTNIKSLWYDSELDEIWIGTFSEGIFKVEPENERISIINPDIVEENETLSIENVTNLVPMGKDYILASTIRGILKIRRSDFMIESILSKNIASLESNGFCFSNDGSLWIAYPYGIIRKDPKDSGNYRHWSSSEIKGLSVENQITSLFCDNEEHIWAGSNGSGLFYYDSTTDTFEKMASIDGNLSINQMCMGVGKDRMYLATNDGIAIFDPRKNVLTKISQDTGFPMKIISSIKVERDSVAYISGDAGLCIVKESDMENAYRDYRLSISGISLDHTYLRPSEEGPLYESTLYQKDIRLKSGFKSLTIRIANSGLGNASGIAYEYRLKGFEDEFRATDSPEVTYTNLPHGKYTFEFRGVRLLDEEQYPTGKMGIEILPPFWISWWFILIAVSLTGGLILFLIYNRSRATRLKMMLEVERKDKERQLAVSQSKTAFITNVSHEFRTPLTLIGSNVEMLMKSSKGEDLVKLMNITRNIEHLDRMLDEFLELNRTRETDFHMDRRLVKINDLLKEEYSLFRDYAIARGILFSFNSNNDEAVAEVDAEMFQRAVSNLLSNAFKYTKDTVSFEMKSERDKIYIIVTDNGVGIKPENISHVFERFWRENEGNTSTGAKGSGIGLSYTKRIVNLHDGSIDVHSTPGEGTIFTISLPAAERPAETVSREESDIIIPEIKSGRKTILVVEDNKPMCETLSTLLSPYYNVLVAYDGSEGLKLAKRTFPDLIISDIMMPQMSGTEMCSKLKSSQETSHIPVILLTAVSAESQMLDALSIGADDYITKPFHNDMLLARIDNILRIRMVLRERYSKYSDEKDKQYSENPLDEKFLKKASEIVNSHLLDDSFGVNDFASEMFVSRTTLFNKMHSLTGLSPNAYILYVKIRKAAREIIENPSENTADIAIRCGFNTPSYFIKCFRKYYGVTPLAYKKQHVPSRLGQM